MSLSNYPTIRPSLILDFQKAEVVDPRITFTRASTATRYNSYGLLETVANDVPRIDFNPTTLVCNGLLVEESRTNSFQYSQDFSNAYWNYNNAVTVTPNNVTAPDGTLTGNLVVPNAGTVNARAGRNPAGTNGVNRTYSFYAKAKELRYITVNTSNTSGYGTCFDLVAGTFIVPTVGVVGTPTMTNVGNGWWRITHTTSTGTVVGIIAGTTYQRLGVSGTDTFNGTDGFYLWGAQNEDSQTFATSYIPTVAATVTRSADVATMTGTNFSSWYNQSEGTIVVQGSNISNGLGSLFAVDDGTANERITNGFSSVNTQLLFRCIDGGSDQANFTVGNITALSQFKMASAYKVNDFAATVNGGTVQTDTSGTLPTVTTARVGCNVSIVNQIGGYLQRISYYPARLTNAQLQALTAT